VVLRHHPPPLHTSVLCPLSDVQLFLHTLLVLLSRTGYAIGSVPNRSQTKLQRIHIVQTGTLVSVPAEEASLRCSSVAIDIRRLGRERTLPAVAAGASGRAAREEDDDGAKEEADHRGQDEPHGDAVVGVRAGAVFVDVVLDDAKDGKVYGHDHEHDDPRDDCDDGGY
jgi:hypothetical protein